MWFRLCWILVTDPNEIPNTIDANEIVSIQLVRRLRFYDDYIPPKSRFRIYSSNLDLTPYAKFFRNRGCQRGSVDIFSHGMTEGRIYDLFCDNLDSKIMGMFHVECFSIASIPHPPRVEFIGIYSAQCTAQRRGGRLIHSRIDHQASSIKHQTSSE